MPCRSDEEDIQLPTDPNYITMPTDRRKCGAERVSFSGEGSISEPSPVTEIRFEKQGLAQEQSTLCAAHVTAIGYRPALRYPFGGVSCNCILACHANSGPAFQLISNEDEESLRMSGKSLLSTLPIINKQWMRMRLLMTFTDQPKILWTRPAL